MNNYEHCRRTTAILTEDNSSIGHTRLYPELKALELINIKGSYTYCIATMFIPYEQDEHGHIVGADVLYNVWVRTLGHHSGAFLFKMQLPACDPFYGKADFNPKCGAAIAEFDEDIRCAAWDVVEKGTLARFKSL